MTLPGSANISRALLLAGALTALAACAPSPPDVADEDRIRLSALHQTRVNAVSSWQLQGKVSILRDGKLWHTGVNWLHSEDGDRLNLTAIGGRTLMRLHNHREGASAMDSRGRTYRAASFRELVARAFGADVPVENLRYWVVGTVADGSGAGVFRLNRDGSLKALRQDGWEVRYLRYRPAQHPLLSRVMMPALLEVSRGDLKLTVAVRRWQLLRFKAAVEEVI